MKIVEILERRISLYLYSDLEGVFPATYVNEGKIIVFNFDNPFKCSSDLNNCYCIHVCSGLNGWVVKSELMEKTKERK